MTKSIVPKETEIGRQLLDAATHRRIVLIVGLPGTGKSLMLQQLTIIASEAGRTVHTLQWDDARSAFETQDWLRVYPEVDNVTHPSIRKAVGLWVRGAVFDWHNAHSTSSDLLIVELPVVGGRFVELLQPLDDASEALLKCNDVLALVPVPTNEMRKVITGFREQTSNNPRNELEQRDAPPHIVEAIWAEVRQLYRRWNGIEESSPLDVRYQETICRSVFEHLCRYRHMQILTIDREFPTAGSVYERGAPTKTVKAACDEVTAAFARLNDLYPGEAAELSIQNWSDY